MAQTRTYADLISNIKGKFGAHSGFTTSELTSIKHLVNSRIQDLFLESNLWENVLVIGEERAVDTTKNTVPYTGAVYDATGANQQNPYTGGAVDTFLRIHKVKPWSNKSAVEYQMAGDATGARLSGYTATYGLSKAIASAGAYPATIEVTGLHDYYVGGTVQLAGFSDSADNGIKTVGSVNAAAYLTGTLSQVGLSDFTYASGSLTGDETIKVPVAFCTYRKRIIDTTYGDGSGETTAIPLEWFEPTACGVVADLHSGDGNEASANKWEAKYEKALQLRLERLDSQQAAQTVGQSIQTHLSEQGRTVNY